MDAFKVIGVSVRTTNKDQKMEQDILDLWGNFLGQNLLEKIPNKVSPEVYSLYTDYESDFTGFYTVILGCKVENFDQVPEGMVAKEIESGQYEQFKAKGNLNDGVVFEAWQKVWNSSLDRAYTCDFEVYGEKAKDPENAEVDLFIAVK